MLKIGEFSELSRISITKLRNYDKQELLTPVYVDQENGYRYYDKSQLVDANRIVSLKSMGFALNEIQQILQEAESNRNEVIQQKMQQKLLQKKQEFKMIVDQIHKIEESLKLNGTEEKYAISIVTKVMPAMKVISYRQQIAHFNQEGILWDKINHLVEQYQIHVTDGGYAIGMQHDFDLEQHFVDAEVMLQVDRLYDQIAPLCSKDIPEREVASIVFQGNYGQISAINSIVAQWLEQNEYEICDTAFSIYHMSPREEKDDMQFVTELCFPIKKKR